MFQSLFFNEVVGLSLNFVKYLRTPFFIEHFWWLLLKKVKRKGSSADQWAIGYEWKKSSEVGPFVLILWLA